MLRLHWQRFSFRKVAYSVLGIYLLITCYTGFHLLNRKLQSDMKERLIQERIKSLSEIADDPDWNPWGEEFESELQPQLHHNPPELWQDGPLTMALNQHRSVKEDWQGEGHEGYKPSGKRSPLERQETNTSVHSVEIWSKAAIGLYLWEHVLTGTLENRMNGVWSYGHKTIGSIHFRFRTGPGLVPDKVPRDTENVLLVLNGREPAKVSSSRLWLDLLTTLPRLHGAGAVLLGDEGCDNSWIQPYMSYRGGPLKFVFLVYDSPEVDNVHFFQWPLGVATYRDFPTIESTDLPLHNKRKYLFNFLGTIYKNSSREHLLSAINGSSYRNLGYVQARMEWLPQETDETRTEYIQVLSNSDLTLNPAGINTECYRIYESMALGSVPVLEDVMTPGRCGHVTAGVSSLSGAPGKARKIFPAPLRLLKEFEAPVLYVKNWTTDLGPLLQREASLSDLDRSKRREELVHWYSQFRSSMRDRLVSVISDKFFSPALR
ncbi:ribitol-5-phosphate xylosyltransferase 1-like [Physella acuta]|uniref:ribitol-5-phosphate xylosyltransferase 1-like n=1 Tax=Physella acuta TaxID=109671 RepID=UPI0027DBD46C|nr:ribitol-5-phosphate xylosyltransferase 1-like [Physella acuta]XP_059152234.1 ribitol-5-phosphate xylosyltransferase 1-like [Physella acuta]XP_059152235.1 ribitol-5-phosphate xylosyltransferase 1-like [Physella acuta]XP_059152236.1 ribitol-5-phosphate xylosyltransferase 1-like [Physella acuta]XP_059152237.1 ribitol-5-phosphate xylosyltransferase 1-like [Physella acuta]XP_059152238.1 ribitol-5-phosphate xylosyltransferase 1-like [Physella acuta]